MVPVEPGEVPVNPCDRYLKFEGDGKQLSGVTYSYESTISDTNFRLTSAKLEFRNNEKVKKELLRFMKKKYGDYYDVMSNSLVWEKPEVTITLVFWRDEVRVIYEPK